MSTINICVYVLSFFFLYTYILTHVLDSSATPLVGQKKSSCHNMFLPGAPPVSPVRHNPNPSLHSIPSRMILLTTRQTWRTPHYPPFQKHMASRKTPQQNHATCTLDCTPSSRAHPTHKVLPACPPWPPRHHFRPIHPSCLHKTGSQVMSTWNSWASWRKWLRQAGYSMRAVYSSVIFPVWAHPPRQSDGIFFARVFLFQGVKKEGKIHVGKTNFYLHLLL